MSKPLTRPIISIEEARKLLGKDSNKITDLQIEKLVDNLHSLAIAFVKMVQIDSQFVSSIKYHKSKKLKGGSK